MNRCVVGYGSLLNMDLGLKFEIRHKQNLFHNHTESSLIRMSNSSSAQRTKTRGTSNQVINKMICLIKYSASYSPNTKTVCLCYIE